MQRSRGKILVIRGGAIGDFILTLPVFAALRQTFPETHVEALAYPKLAELAARGNMLDGFRSIEARALAGFFARGGKLDPELSAYFESFSVIFSYLYDPDGIFQKNVGETSKAQFIVGPHRPNESDPMHATEVFLQPLRQLAIFDADPVPRLNFDSELIETERRIAIHPGSGSVRKNWPEERWAEFLARFLDLTSWNVLLVGGEAEGDRIQRLASGAAPGRVEVSFNQPLAELASTLSRVRYFAGHDSGITHLAAAVGIPLLALWGESNDTIWRPRSATARILKATDGLQGLPVARVLEEVMRALPG